jgi:hypothetical protein
VARDRIGEVGGLTRIDCGVFDTAPGTGESRVSSNENCLIQGGREP